MNSVEQYPPSVSQALQSLNTEAIEKAVQLLRKTREADGCVWIFGNGGSAATASHFANDLLKMGGLRAVALPDMTPTLTAYGNDDGWENMFAAMLRGLLRERDALVAISCSGKSPNVVVAARTFVNSRTIVLTGPNPASPLVKAAPHIVIRADHPDIRVQEDLHLVVCHAIAGALKEEANEETF